MRFTRHGIRAGLTLIELLCVIAIIMVLAGLLLGPASRVLRRVCADQWAEESSVRLDAVVEQLQKCLQGRQDFPVVTLEWIEANHLVSAFELENYANDSARLNRCILD
jgi:prepilin-type N-terminal cleavage/methylation domain-containing protein